MATQLTTLSNGLRVISDQISHVETAAVGLWVGVGARHETSSVNGISHFLEHMAFKGTVNLTAHQIAETIEQVGGYLNAYTGRETTAYYARILAHDTRLAIDLLADILQFSVFHDDELEKERKVILQEISETYDTPDDLVFELFQNAAYADQALGRSILGTANTVKQFSRQDLLHHQRTHYAADNMILSTAGKIHHDDIVRYAEEKFCHLSSEGARSHVPAHYQGGITLQSKDLEQLHFVLGFESPALSHELYYACNVLSTLLGGGMSSRLFQRIREQMGLAYSVYTFNSAFTDTGILGIYAGTDPNDVNALLPALHTEIRQLKSSLTDHEIIRAKAQLKSHLLMGLENTATRCEMLANHMLVYGRPLSLAELLDRIDAVNIDGLIACADMVFKTKPTIAALGAYKDAQLFTDYSTSVFA